MVRLPRISLGTKKRKNYFDLSHDVETTSGFGFCQPTIVRHMNAGSSSSLTTKIGVRLAPLPQPTFGRIKLKTYNTLVPIQDVFLAYDYMQKKTSVQSSSRSYIPDTADHLSNRMLFSLILYQSLYAQDVYHSGIVSPSNIGIKPFLNFTLATPDFSASNLYIRTIEGTTRANIEFNDITTLSAVGAKRGYGYSFSDLSVALYNAFFNELDTSWNCEDIFNTFFNSFYTLTPPSMPACPDNIKCDLTNGQLIEGKKNVLGSIRQVTLSSENDLMVYITPFSDVLKQLCIMVCLSAKKDININLLTIKDDSINGRQNNLSTFTNLLSSLLICNAKVGKINGNMEFLLKNTAFPFYIITDKEVILFSEDAESAMFFNADDVVSLYRKMFAGSAEQSQPFIQKFSNAIDFFDNIDYVFFTKKDEDLYIIKKYPCIVFESNTQLIYDYIADVDEAQKLAKNYVKFLGCFTNIKSVNNVFPENTIDSYLHDECFYECSKHLSKSIPIELRRTMLEKLIDWSADEKAKPFMLRLPGFQNSALYLVNIFSGGQIILFYSFENSYHIFTADDKDIADSIISYIHSMLRCGILRSKDDSVEIMRQKLTE